MLDIALWPDIKISPVWSMKSQTASVSCACAKRSLPGSGTDIGQVWGTCGKKMVATPLPARRTPMADLAYREVYRMSTEETRLRMVMTYQQTHSISATAREWHCARQTVRRWVQRFAAEGAGGLADRSRRPRHCPRQTAPALEEAVRRAWEGSHYGRLRLALCLRAQGIALSPHTIRHILRRSVPPRTRRRRVHAAGRSRAGTSTDGRPARPPARRLRPAPPRASHAPASSAEAGSTPPPGFRAGGDRTRCRSPHDVHQR